MLITRFLEKLVYDVKVCHLSPSFYKVSKPRTGRYVGNKVAIVFSKHYHTDLKGLESMHVFDTHRYSKIFEKLIKQKVIVPHDVFVPAAITEKDLLLIHTSKYLESLDDPKSVALYLESMLVDLLSVKSIRKIIDPVRHICGGTLLASRMAMECGIAINIGGGYHHAKPRYGEGFCLLADIPVAIARLKQEGRFKKALIIDLDVHQGNGTILCLQEDLDIFTFSMHQKDIYPSPKEVGDLDIDLDAGTTDSQYLSLLSEHLPDVIAQSDPEIAFLLAGCDTLASDPLASVEMTGQGIVQRDLMVIEALRSRNIPVVMTLAGGYSPETAEVQYHSIRSIIETFGK